MIVMTNTYMVHAWCTRPFISWIEVEAGTPEEAVAKAGLQDAELLDAAEECNSGYPWNEFTVYDEDGKELLHVLDTEARLRDAAPAMRDTLLYVAQELAAFKPEYLRQIGLNVVLEQVEMALAIADGTATEAPAPAASVDQD
jgi:hypothetical protein